MFRWQGRKVVDGFVDSSGEAGGGDVVAKNSAVYNLREEGGLRNQFLHQVRDILLTFRRESFLVARTSSEGDDDHFPFLLGNACPGQHSGAEQCAAQGDSSRAAQKLPAREGQPT